MDPRTDAPLPRPDEPTEPARRPPGAATTAGTESPLERYVRILEIVAAYPDGISAADVGASLSLPKATAHRLLRNLAEVEALVQIAPGVACYRLGSRLDSLLFAAAGDDWLPAIVRPVLRDLVSSSGQAAFVAALRGNVVRSVEMLAPNDIVRVYIRPGQEIPLHAGASAKAILALQPSRIIDRLLSKPLRRLTPTTLVDPEMLRHELATIRDTGVSCCAGEDVEGFAGIAAPITVAGRPTRHSVCVTGTLDALFGAERPAHETRVRDAAARIAGLMATRLRPPAAVE